MSKFLLASTLMAGALSVLGTVSPAAEARLFTEAEIRGSTMVYDSGTFEDIRTDPQSDEAPTPDSSVHSGVLMDSSFVGVAAASSSAGLGWLRAASVAEAQTGDNSNADNSASAGGGWSDTLQMLTTDPTLIGTEGSMRVVLRTDGSLFVNAGFAGSASASANVGLTYTDPTGIAQTVTRAQAVTYIAGGVFSGDDSLDIDVTIPFLWNVPFDVSVELYAHSSASGFEGLVGASGQAFADFGHTSEWGGVLEVRDHTGASVQDFDVVGASGTGYRYAITAPPIPEPSSVLLMFSGIALLGVRRFARR